MCVADWTEVWRREQSCHRNLGEIADRPTAKFTNVTQEQKIFPCEAVCEFVIYSGRVFRERGAPLVLRAPPRPRVATKRSPPPRRDDLIIFLLSSVMSTWKFWAESATCESKSRNLGRTVWICDASIPLILASFVTGGADRRTVHCCRCSLTVDCFLASLSLPWFELRFSAFQVFGTELVKMWPSPPFGHFWSYFPTAICFPSLRLQYNAATYWPHVRVLTWVYFKCTHNKTGFLCVDQSCFGITTSR